MTFRNRAVQDFVAAFADACGLSRRESEVLCLSATGVRQKEVAALLHCSPQTVETYWRRITIKTGIGCREEILPRLLAVALKRLESSGGKDEAS